MNYIQMNSGARVYVAPETLSIDEEKSLFYLDDLAHALANLCRFAGHTNQFYSVAQHSVFVARIVAANAAVNAEFTEADYDLLCAQALFHDASEAILADIPKPMKMLVPDYQRLEKQVQSWIMRRLGLPEHEAALVKVADRVALATESYYLMGENMAPDLQPITMDILPLHPAAAKGDFIRAASETLARITSFTSDHFSELVLDPTTFSSPADDPSTNDTAPSSPEHSGDLDAGDDLPGEVSNPGENDIVDEHSD
jgi:5'-deoxynucleotidase YfbR-like HD superfamily hydrolase